MGGLITGLLQGLGQGLHQAHTEGMAKHQQEVETEMQMLKSLSESEDPHIQAIAMSGLMRLASGQEKPQKGFLGKLFGNYEKDPAFQQLLPLATQAKQEKAPQAQPQAAPAPPSNPTQGLVSPPTPPNSPLVSSFGAPSNASSPSPSMDMSQPVSTPANPVQINPAAVAGAGMQPPSPMPAPSATSTEEDIPTKATELGFPTGPLGMPTAMRTKAMNSLLSGRESDKDKARYEAQIKAYQVKHEDEDRQKAAELATKHTNKMEEIGLQGKNQKDVAAMRIAAKKAITASGGNPNDYTDAEIDALAQRATVGGESVTSLLPTGKAGNSDRTRLGRAIVATGQSKATAKDIERDQAYGNASVQIQHLLKMVKAAREETNPLKKEEMFVRLNRLAAASAIPVVRAIGDNQRVTQVQAAQFKNTLTSDFARMIAVPGAAEGSLNEMQSLIDELRTQSRATSNRLGTPPGVGKYTPGQKYKLGGKVYTANVQGHIPEIE